MGKGNSEEWDMQHPDTVRNQPPSYAESEKSDKKKGSSKSSCPKCCLKTRDCLMSAECGRALQISQVVAMCGMCLRWFICKSQPQLLPLLVYSIEVYCIFSPVYYWLDHILHLLLSLQI